MRVLRERSAAAFLLLAMLAPLPALGGASYVIAIENHRNGHTGTATIDVEGLNIKFGMAKLGRRQTEGELIFQGERPDGKPPRVVVIDGEGGHMYISQARMEELAKMLPQDAAPMMNEQMLEMARKQIEGIADEEARRRALEDFERRFGDASTGTPVETVFVERGVREKAGYPCVRYDATRGGVKLSELFATDWVNVPGGRQTKRAFDAFGVFYQSLLETMEKMSGMNAGMLGGDNNPYQKMIELGRFIVASYEYSPEGELVQSAELESAEKVDHSPEVFKPAKDSVERSFPGM